MTEDQQPHFAGALYVGAILVAVSGEAFGFKAKSANDSVLGLIELGFEVSATAYDQDDKLLDNEDNEGVVADLVREAIDRLRYALARCFIFGKMELINDGLTDEEDWEVIEKVWDSLPESYFEITPALAAEACIRQEKRDAAFGAWLEQLGEFMEAQQKHPDENITLGEAEERQAEGAEVVRKIVDGDKEE
jgi:hypothetical protein